MKDLSKLTNEELIAYYEEMQEIESVEYSMDGSGECGHYIAATFEPIWAKFEKEFESRNIPEVLFHKISNEEDAEMPY